MPYPLQRQPTVCRQSATPRQRICSLCSNASATGLAGTGSGCTHSPGIERRTERGRLENSRTELRLGSAPLILVVGSHEPRKNHLAVLEAAESLWRRASDFQLVPVGGSGWKGEEFDTYVESATQRRETSKSLKGRRDARLVVVSTRTSFIFPSLVEGYGCPYRSRWFRDSGHHLAHGAMPEVVPKEAVHLQSIHAPPPIWPPQ